MPCYSPLKGWIVGKTPSGKDEIRITAYDAPSLLWNGKRYVEGDPGTHTLKIPCGKCSGCRMAYAREWANRLMLELSLHDSAYFVTLTYDDEHIVEHCARPRSDPDTGELIGSSLSLNKIDFQLFMKRLRKRFEDQKIRFYAVGEYGSHTARPHYHVILFGLRLPDDDLHFYKRSELGYDYQNSDALSEVWSFGFNVVAPVTWESCCYTARYMMKKLKGPEAKLYDDNNLDAPWSLMSRKPGIAHDYYLLHPEWTDRSSLVFPTESGYREFPPPKYLEKLLEVDSPEEAAERKLQRRQIAENTTKAILKRTDKSEIDYLKVLEKNFEKAQNLLDSFRNL